MNDTTRNTILLIGRILIALIFIMSGIHKITAFAGTAEQIAGKGLPLPQLLTVGAIVFELGGGLLLVFGLKCRVGALLLILFLIPTTVFFHNFWAFEGKEMQKQMIGFMKNLSIMGGLAILLVHSPGGFALSSEDDRDVS